MGRQAGGPEAVAWTGAGAGEAGVGRGGWPRTLLTKRLTGFGMLRADGEQ